MKRKTKSPPGRGQLSPGSRAGENDTHAWRGKTIYQIYPLSFRDSNGDGWGDLPGVTAGLDHVASLGVDAIWVTPFYRSPFVDFGYDTIDHKAVDPRFGTLNDFDTLLKRAHKLGLKVIIDQVWSYTSHLHPWFVESRQQRGGPKDDWYIWADPKPDGTDPNNWRALFGGPAWEWNPVRRQYYMTHFMAAMPHLNVQNPAVQEALLDIGRFWLDRGVDGFRLDVANYYMVDPRLRDNPASGSSDFELPVFAQTMVHDGSLPENLDFIGRIRDLADSYGAYLVAELSTDNAARDLADYTLENKRCHSAYAHALGHDTSRSLCDDLTESLPAWNRPDSWPTMFLSNHDIVRGLSRCFPETETLDQAKLLLAILFATRGNIHLYQGDELGLPHGRVPFEKLRDPEGQRHWPKGSRRDGARVPFPWNSAQPYAGFSTADPWLPVDAVHAQRALNEQTSDNTSTLSWTRRLIALRNNSPALRLGDQFVLGVPAPLFALDRRYGSDALRCLFNTSAQSMAIQEGGEVLLASPNATLTHLPRYGALFIKRT